MIQPILTQLQVDKIESNFGYTILQTEQIFLPKIYNYSLHIINLQEFQVILEDLKDNILLLPEDTHYTLMNDVDKIQDKLLTLSNGHHTIQKRGLFNFLGTIDKWIAGTMDNEDREIVNQHLQVIDANNHNIISNVNQQVDINKTFNISINKLLDTIKNDRQIIQNYIHIETDKNRLKMAIIDIRLNIQETDRILTELQDNIILSNLNVIHPSLLTHKEIIEFHINADKIKNLKVGFSKTNTDKLIFLIKIPYTMSAVNKKLIIPLSNTISCNKLNFPITQTLEYKNEYYEYNVNKGIHQLNKLKHCINKKCGIVKDCNTEINNIDDNSILIQLANNTILYSNCDERKFHLNGNYFIKFNNCTINIDNNSYNNNIKEIKNKYIIPNLDHKFIESNPIIFKNLSLDVMKNTEKIEEIKYHKKLVYTGLSVSTLTILIILVAIIYILYSKSTNKKIKIINKIQDPQTKVTNFEHLNSRLKLKLEKKNQHLNLEESPV